MEEPKITVGIMSEDEITFVFNGEFILEEDDSEKLTGKHKAKIHDGVVLFQGKQFPKLSFIPQTDNCDFELIGVTIGKSFHWEQKENLKFRGDLIIITENNKLTAINRVAVEEYLASVISSEMSATSAIELLKAHAIISRSWVLAQINKENKSTKDSCALDSETEHIKWYDKEDHINFDVCADDHCQRYQGITRESTDAVKEALKKTCGEVLKYEGEICDARFSKSCGGVSETFENCWEETPHPYLKKVIDNRDELDINAKDLTVEKNARLWILSNPESFCNTTDDKILSQVLVSYDQKTKDFFRWKVEFNTSELSKLIKKKTGIDFGDIQDLIPIERGQSGRIIKLKIAGSKKTLIIGKELEIRKALSESHLYSSAFIVEKEMDKEGRPIKFILTGAGWGHGVGLCQIGAAVMASKGYNYQEILKHYYKNATIEKEY
ncbi:MAG: SpoIID/LytB domain-containing protein [Paludibacteraceae bacterium]|nr:SpoIID/LytB domain-containing protein [Paludibacteraceae bacterium]HOU68540.1 SpoIID/LytB domain-containing protein [Paludibacteraceae bacterium]HQF50368.1 SpoIID/LytB domain-containing protein [Paludibacteraceae bacterium]